MSVVQVCSRCATRWPVAGSPAQWCPRCHGALHAPVDSARPVPSREPVPARGRNFRWVARSPYPPIGRPRPGPHSSGRPRLRYRGPTPRYSHVPRWGLLDPPPPEPEVTADRTETAADLAPILLVCTAIVFGLAALAEAFRYGLLVFNRVRLVDPLTLAISDAMVWSTQVSAPLVALAAAVTTVCRLIVTRREVYAARGVTDPRSPRTLALGSLVPGVNLVMPGVFLTEVAAGDRRTLTTVRIWWGVWVTNGALAVLAWVWRGRDTLQAQADGVVLAAVTAAVACVSALLTLYVIRRLEGRDWFGRPRRAARWINVPTPPRPDAREEVTVG